MSRERSRKVKEKREKKTHKKKAANSYLSTLKEFKSCTNVGDPVDPF